MDRAVVEQYLARVAAAASVRDLHALVRSVRLAHGDDPDADDVEQACWAAALRVVAAPPPRTRPSVGTLPAYTPPHAPARAERLAYAGAPTRVDWKERAARA